MHRLLTARNITLALFLVAIIVIVYLLLSMQTFTNTALTPPAGVTAVEPMQVGPSLRPIMIGGGGNSGNNSADSDNFFILPFHPAPVPALVFRTISPPDLPPVGETARQVKTTPDIYGNSGFLAELLEANKSQVGEDGHLIRLL